MKIPIIIDIPLTYDLFQKFPTKVLIINQLNPTYDGVYKIERVYPEKDQETHESDNC